jgi:leader peptidase (prepilin peptidase)/N-methyltransferase
MLMIYTLLIVLGLCLGSFVNALVWRIHEQADEKSKKKPSKKRLEKLSISRGHSICPSCSHRLAAIDLVPVLSWISLRGKCRYCKKPISPQYPLVELLTSVLFVLSYISWPFALHGFSHIFLFCLWIPILTGLIALSVYDFKWYLLPNRILYPISVLAVIYAGFIIGNAHRPWKVALNEVLAILIGGGIFYIIFQVSNGKWIGGGDVKLGLLLGLLVGTPAKALLFIFAGSVVGSLLSLPLLAQKKLKVNSAIPFGPLLITGGYIAVVYGTRIINWYHRTFIV